MGSDQRIGPQFLGPGLGYGGSCFPKDLESLIFTLAEHKVPNELLLSVRTINQGRVQRAVDRIRAILGGFEGKQVALWGLAFKPNTDDMRDAKSLEIIRLLLKEGANVKAYDPAAMENARAVLGDTIEYCANLYDTAEGSHIIVLMTEWREFKFVNMEKIRSLMRRPVIFDGRNMYNEERKRRQGFEYYAVGIGGIPGSSE